FSSNLAHDLRSPLTRLRGTLRDGAAQQAGEGAALATTFDRAERECAAIIGIFDALLRLAEIESGRHPAAIGAVALAPLVEDIVETMEPVIADH
ncbi:histidine kinase dimerization/phospho-acceptor domain-containing protein, partial [Escherichia coli]|uniref:histidine kinase dimerization/phospho-acceptor domain-containing protein n=2 Tax=Pseudomonadota TaxID=1224 RepID=UPI003CE52CFC